MGFRLFRRKKKSNFKRAADGSMTLMDHLRELRSRLLKASLGIVAGLIIGLFFAQEVLVFLTAPICEFQAGRGMEGCTFQLGSPIDEFLLNLRVALFLGLLMSAPIWLFQLWAFIAPGLHRNERRYSYYFVAVATPLFLGGAILGHFVLVKSLNFVMGLTSYYDVVLNLSDTFTFVTQVMILFGIGFEFPLIIAMLNVFGIASAQKLLGWWRVVVLISFLFCAIVTPTPDPFGMTILALAMCALYFIAVGFAFLNDKRRGRKANNWSNLDDDEASTIDDVVEPVGAPEDADASGDASDSRQLQRRRRYDDDAT